jgi:hypothetical protein
MSSLTACSAGLGRRSAVQIDTCTAVLPPLQSLRMPRLTWLLSKSNGSAYEETPGTLGMRVEYPPAIDLRR